VPCTGQPAHQQATCDTSSPNEAGLDQKRHTANGSGSCRRALYSWRVPHTCQLIRHAPQRPPTCRLANDCSAWCIAAGWLQCPHSKCMLLFSSCLRCILTSLLPAKPRHLHIPSHALQQCRNLLPVPRQVAILQKQQTISSSTASQPASATATHLACSRAATCLQCPGSSGSGALYNTPTAHRKLVKSASASSQCTLPCLQQCRDLPPVPQVKWQWCTVQHTNSTPQTSQHASHSSRRAHLACSSAATYLQCPGQVANLHQQHTAN
jgi:hypothetical protein